MIEQQETSNSIWQQKYQLRDTQGNQVDHYIEDTFRRVAKALATKESSSGYWEEKFYQAMCNGAYPAGRILANAGAEGYKPNASNINCTVANTISDSMEGILEAVKQAGITLAAGCGIGYDFSTLRPSGAYVAGVGASTSGSLSFMDIFDSMCFTVASAGGRRGAQMGTMICDHPDIFNFIKAKREDGRLRQFNLSVLITDEFMDAVKYNHDWFLIFPVHKKEYDPSNHYIWRNIHWQEDYFVPNNLKQVAHKVYATVKAKDLWDTIMKSTYDYAEPGVIFIDRVNEFNPLNSVETIRTCNPCGEQFLPSNGACLLGSIDLTKFVVNPFTTDAYFDYERYKQTIRVFTKMLDNVVEINGLPLEAQREEILSKRRHGMGYLGLGSAMIMLNIDYGSKDSLTFTSNVTELLAKTNWEESYKLAKEKGEAPIFEDPVVFDSWLNSKYISKLPTEIRDYLKAFGSRFTHATSIAPTGTLSLALANNASNGIEPSFAHSYKRNVIVHGKKSKEQVEVISKELYEYRKYKNDPTLEAPSYWKTAETVTPLEHLQVQAAAQQWIDSAISKTINVPTDIPFEDFKAIYIKAYELGVKGCTTFRFNPEAFSGVLVKDKDLNSTTYIFTLENGATVECKGSDTIDYEGESHTASNLFDSLKEGYYGKL